MTNQSEKLYAMIPEGEDNAIHMSDLSARLGMSERDVRKIILDLRKAGFLIAGSISGYFRPTSHGEIRRFYNQRKAAALSTLESLKAAREALKQLEGQVTLDPAEGCNGNNEVE